MPRSPRYSQRQLDDLVGRRCGVVRVRDLRGLGMSPSTIAARCRPGARWQRILPGVVLTFSGAASFQHRAIAGLLYVGSGAVLTGLAALWLRGFRDLPPDRPLQYLIPARRHRKPRDFVHVERTHRMPSHTWIRDLPVAPVARAVIDACRSLRNLDSVRAIVAEAVQRDHCRLTDLLDELTLATRHGSRLPRIAIMEVVDSVRSVAEAKAYRLLERAGLAAALWNHDVFDERGRWLGRPDAIWPALGVVLEVDSRTWHLSPASWRRTQARQRRFAKYGLIVISVAPSDLLEHPDEILQEITEALARAAGRPAPKLTVRPPE